MHSEIPGHKVQNADGDEIQFGRDASHAELKRLAALIQNLHEQQTVLVGEVRSFAPDLSDDLELTSNMLFASIRRYLDLGGQHTLVQKSPDRRRGNGNLPADASQPRRSVKKPAPRQFADATEIRGRLWSGTEQTRRAMIELLSELDEPIPSAEIAARLEAKGWLPRSQDRPRVISRIAWNNKDLFEGNPTVGYRLVRK